MLAAAFIILTALLLMLIFHLWVRKWVVVLIIWFGWVLNCFIWFGIIVVLFDVMVEFGIGLS